MRRPTAEQAIAPPRARRVARLAHLAPPAPPAKRSESIAPQILHLGPPTSEAKIGPATAHLARFEAWKSDMVRAASRAWDLPEAIWKFSADQGGWYGRAIARPD